MHATMRQTGSADRQWYVLRVATRREGTVSRFLNPTDEEIAEAAQISNRLAVHLIARRFKPYVPMMREKRTRGRVRRKTVVERPMFPGYAFIRLDFQADKERLDILHQAPGLIGFVQFNGAYAVMPEKAMELICRAEAAALIPRNRASVFREGEQVRVFEGPFAGFPAHIERLDDSDRVAVLINIFGRATLVDVDEECLEKI